MHMAEESIKRIGVRETAENARSEMRMGTSRGSRPRGDFAPGDNRIRSEEGVPTGEEISSAEGNVLKGGLILFWTVAGIAIGKDLLDILCALFDLIGVGLAGTVLAAPIGIPLAVLSEIINKLSGLIIDATMLVYFWYIGGKMGVRLAAISIGAILDAVPLLNVLPMTTITFFLAYLIGKVLQHGVVGKVNKVMSAGKRVVKVLKYV